MFFHHCYEGNNISDFMFTALGTKPIQNGLVLDGRVCSVCLDARLKMALLIALEECPAHDPRKEKSVDKFFSSPDLA